MDSHSYFTWIDWTVLFGYLLMTTWFGHLLKGKQASIRDFFLGGRSLPWPAVSGSIIATEISGVTFVGVPAAVFAVNGDFTYLQWAIGSIIGRVLVGWFFVRAYYEREIYSPYDYMGEKLGVSVKQLATFVFWLGSILGQSVRVLVAALALRAILPPYIAFEWCIIIIGVFAIGWTLMGGMRTVIWTDVVQFCLFTLAGLLALFWIIASLDGGWGEFWRIGSGGLGIEALWTPDEGRVNKFFLFDDRWQRDLEFTFWVAILAVPFLNLSAFGVDQLNAQRMFCCRSAADARKAIIASSFGQLLTLLMLLVGAGLFAYYTAHPPTPAEAGVFSADADLVFPIWITTVLPVGLSGLILAGIFAAAISSLDSILAALSQTTLSLFHHHDEARTDAEDEGRRGVFISRVLVIGWGIALTSFAIVLNVLRDNINMLPLAFGMVAYTTGPMLGIFLAALFKTRASFAGLATGFALSVLAVLYVKPDLYKLFIAWGKMTVEQAAAFGPFTVTEDGNLKANFAFPWMYPITTFLTLGFGILIPRRRSRPVSE